MKVALVVPGGVARLPDEGQIPCLTWLIEHLAQRHEVHVFSLHWLNERLARRRHAHMVPLLGAPPPNRYPFCGAMVHEGGTRYAGLRTLAAMLAEHRRAPFDVFHALWITPPGVLAAVAGKLLRRPVVIHVAGGELVALPDIGYGGLCTARGRFWARVGLAGATSITAASAPMIDAIRGHRRSAQLIPLGVDVRAWPPVSPRARRPGTIARLMHVGDLNPVKDQFTLLDAARKLADHGVEFQLTIAGRDTLGGTVQAHAQALGLADRVRFLGRVAREPLHALMAESDILLLSSRHEAGPIAVLEAAVAGVPTVGTAVGHVAEWAPRAAVAVPVRDPEALACETLTLLGDDARRLSLAHEAQRRALEHDADWTAGRFESLYEEIATATRRTGRG